MQPILFQWGSFVVGSFAASMNAGLIAAIAIVALEARRLTIRSAIWLDAVLAAITIGVVCARLGYAAINWVYFKDHLGEILRLWEGGLAWHAGLIGGSIGAWLIAHRSRERSPMSVMDVLSIGAPLGVAFGWIGCYLSAVAYGKELFPSDPFFFLAVDAPDGYAVTNPRWPSQLFGAVWAVSVFLMLWVTRRKAGPLGLRYWLFIALYSFGALIIGFTRGDDVPIVGGWRLDQIMDGLLVVIGLIQVLRLYRRRAARAAT